jgi:lysostaphin
MEMELRPQLAKQGETVEVLLREPGGATGGTDAADGAAPPVVHFRNKTYKSFLLPANAAEESAAAQDRVYRVLLGIPADLNPGTYKLQCGKLEQSIKVSDASFGVQVLRLPPGKDNFNGSPGEAAAVDSAKATVSPHQYWEGKFVRPSKARISSPFGLRRRVNGKLLKDYFHSGLDFAGAAGSPVVATQTGKVLIAHQGWKLHGNTICIDHGQGVLSFYIHLSRIFVHEGDIVKAGEKIGAIGSTGRANGPHLHFSVYVNNDSTNPSGWFNNSH